MSPDDGEVKRKPGRKKISKKEAKRKPKKPTRPTTDAERKAARAKSEKERRAKKKALLEAKKKLQEESEKQEEPKKPENSPRPKKQPKTPREEVRAAIPGIVNKFVKLAKGGSCQHLKTLLEQYPDAVGADERAGQESLTELLLKEIGAE